MKIRRSPDKLATTVYFTEREVDILEKIAKRENRSRTEQTRLIVLKALGLRKEDEDEDEDDE